MSSKEVIICDACGLELEWAHHRRHLEFSWVTPGEFHPLGFGHTNMKRWDFCKPCGIKFLAALEQALDKEKSAKKHAEAATVAAKED